jgi:hypothetical protein
VALHDGALEEQGARCGPEDARLDHGRQPVNLRRKDMEEEEEEEEEEGEGEE